MGFWLLFRVVISLAMLFLALVAKIQIALRLFRVLLLFWMTLIRFAVVIVRFFFPKQ